MEKDMVNHVHPGENAVKDGPEHRMIIAVADGDGQRRAECNSGGNNMTLHGNLLWLRRIPMLLCGIIEIPPFPVKKTPAARVPLNYFHLSFFSVEIAQELTI